MEKIVLSAMLSTIQKQIRENRQIIEKLNQIDKKHFDIEVNIEKLIHIIEEYKGINPENVNKTLQILCDGDPYIVLNIGLIALISSINIKINIDETMLGVNTYILKIINNAIEKNKVNAKLELIGEPENYENTILIDRVNDYNILKVKYSNIKFIPYKAIDVYTEGDEFYELFENIYNYALNQNIDIDVFDDEGIEAMFEYGMAKRKLILTRNKDVIQKYSDENVYINENPFKKEQLVFDENIIKEIIGK